MEHAGPKSKALYSKASEVMEGGVSSPVRAFKSVGGDPLFISRGKGSKLWDADGREFVDYVCSWGAMILGHAHPGVMSATTRAIERGTSFGAPTEGEVLLAEQIRSAMPLMEKVRFVNSGTEATMSALRAARAFTKRSKMVKFAGCYHGHSDPFLSSAGSGMAALDIPISAGVTPGEVADSVTLPYNDLDPVRALFEKEGDEVAAVVVEPVAGNMGMVPPEDGFLEGLRKECDRHGALLVFDEVITGFRVGRGGAQGLYGVAPDLTTLGKVIGGGFPVGAYGGRKDVMGLVAPEGPVYQAGTLSGNPVAMSAGLATVSSLDDGAYAKLEESGRTLQEGLLAAAERAGVDFCVNRVGSMLGVFFQAGPVRNFSEARKSDPHGYSKFFWELIGSGVYFAPSAYETTFVSLAHGPDDISRTLKGAEDAFMGMRK